MPGSCCPLLTSFYQWWIFNLRNIIANCGYTKWIEQIVQRGKLFMYHLTHVRRKQPVEHIVIVNVRYEK